LQRAVKFVHLWFEGLLTMLVVVILICVAQIRSSVLWFLLKKKKKKKKKNRRPWAPTLVDSGEQISAAVERKAERAVEANGR
jgi:flagellar basal body-associated protein FliL